MGVLLTDEQKDIVGLFDDFMKHEVKPHLKEIDASGEFPVELYKKAFELGFHLIEIPEEYGGNGFDHQTVGVILETMGYYDPGFAITILCSSLAMKCVLLGGNEKQIAYVSEILGDSGFGAFCLTEPNAGSDAAALKTKYRRDGDEFVISGNKCFVTNGQFADIFIVFATMDSKLGAKGVSAFIVEKDRAGIHIGSHEDKMGLRLSNTCEVAFDDVRIPVENLLGEEGKGFNISMAGLDIGRLNNACIAVGICQAALDEAVAYAKERVQFGKPIIKQQAIQTILADMAIQTEAARQLVRSGMYKCDLGMKITKEASMAKTFCSDTAVKVTSDAFQVFGGYGYSKDYPVEKMMRDSKIFQIFEGTNQIQRTVIARELAK